MRTTESWKQGFKGLNEYFNLTQNITQFKGNVLFWLVKIVIILDFDGELTQKKVVANGFIF